VELRGKLSEIIQRMRNNHLIIRAARDLDDRYSDELTDDLGINSDSMPNYSGLKHQPAVIILNHLEVGIEESDQPGVHNTGAAVKISPMIGLDSVVDTVQRSHHNVRTDHISLGNDWPIHDFGSKGCPISLFLLVNSGLWTACRHGSVKECNAQKYTRGRENVKSSEKSLTRSQKRDFCGVG
jgi:hypothetical protein